jgi:hypothetical protein
MCNCGKRRKVEEKAVYDSKVLKESIKKDFNETSPDETSLKSVAFILLVVVLIILQAIFFYIMFRNVWKTRMSRVFTQIPGDKLKVL